MRKICLALLIFLSFALLMPLHVAEAQDARQVQALNGSLAPGEVDVYLLSGLKGGQVFTAFMQNTSGDLDPILTLLPTGSDLAKTLADYRKEVDNLLATSPQPLLDLPPVRDKYSLAWDDDSGPGYTAALKYTIPNPGDYYLLANGSLSAVGRNTVGSYRLLIGLDAPDVLTGTAAPTGAQIAVHDQTALPNQRIQEITGTLGKDKPTTTIHLSDLNPGDTLYVRVDATSGDLKPVLLLQDYGRKPVQYINMNAQSSTATLQQPFPEGGSNFVLELRPGSQDEQVTSGDYRLVAGVNSPEVLIGGAVANSQSVLILPIPVMVGFKLQQIINIDQQNEIMNDVGTLRLEWTDPALAFNPDDCHCADKLYTDNNFNQFLADVKNKWPAFTFFNQQGNRWTQNRLIEYESSGHIIYLERFTANFQLNFNWVKFPFDHQDFYIRLDIMVPEDNYVFVPMQGYSVIDPENGEDEFKISNFDTQISTETSSRLVPISRFTFHFSAPRHLDYYIFRIFVPILLIITVSYATFFLKDYTRRIEIATGNLLLFIAFSFSLGDNYPRMGYLTFLDAVMAITFIINTLVVVLNVYFKWLETSGKVEIADRLEMPFDYIYPLAYLISFGIAVLIFLR
jgi:hypothetical protein